MRGAFISCSMLFCRFFCLSENRSNGRLSDASKFYHKMRSNIHIRAWLKTQGFTAGYVGTYSHLPPNTSQRSGKCNYSRWHKRIPNLDIESSQSKRADQIPGQTVRQSFGAHHLKLIRKQRYFGSATHNPELNDTTYVNILTKGMFGQMTAGKSMKWVCLSNLILLYSAHAWCCRLQLSPSRMCTTIHKAMKLHN